MSKRLNPSKGSSHGVRRSAAYEVGYGKPPVSRQFKPGQSGNPKGRPRGSKGFSALMRRALLETIPVREDGQLRHMSRREAIIKTWITRALKGDSRAIDRLLPFMQQLDPDIAHQIHTIRRIIIDPKHDPDNSETR